MSLQHRRCNSAFTLVELLVVVGIIALLVSILMPTLSKARAQAQRIKCQAQLRQLGMATLMYSTEYKGRFPVQTVDAVDHFLGQATLDSPAAWSRSALATLMKYLGGDRSLLACPSAGEIPWMDFYAPTSDSDTNYMFNAAVIDRLLPRLRNVSELIMVQEDRYRWRIAWLRPCRTNPGMSPAVYCAWAFENESLGQEYGNVHPYSQNSGMGNYLFCDGHVEAKFHRQIHPTDFGLTGGDKVTGRDDDSNINTYKTYYSSNE